MNAFYCPQLYNRSPPALHYTDRSALLSLYNKNVGYNNIQPTTDTRVKTPVAIRPLDYSNNYDTGDVSFVNSKQAKSAIIDDLLNFKMKICLKNDIDEGSNIGFCKKFDSQILTNTITPQHSSWTSNGSERLKEYRVVSNIADNGLRTEIFSRLNSSTTTMTMLAIPSEEFTDERVQVDRRKLEQMIAGSNHLQLSHAIGDFQVLTTSTSAEDFFSLIMTRTGTQITWPLRLKIGAKTKKDPYVKIFGRHADVAAAKAMVLSVLETRHTRVTLKIDVAFTDHSHIIGKHGRNTQQVMKETGCHIHFPDSNRNPDLEKSNMVSIAGPLHSVEKARHAIRKLAPLVITFEMKTYAGAAVAELNEDALVLELAAVHNLSVLVRPNRNSGHPFVVVKGSAYQESAIREVIVRLQEHFLKTVTITCSTSLEILPCQQAVVLGPNSINILIISQITGASIHHPKSELIGATTFFIQGTLDAVLSARKHLIGCLPIAFMFEVTDNAGKSIDTKEIEKQTDLSITLRQKKAEEARQSILVKGPERQVTAAYSVKLKFCDDTEEKTTVVCRDYDFMRDFDDLSRMSTIFPALFASPITTISPVVINSPAIALPSPLISAGPTPAYSAASVGQVFTFPCVNAISSLSETSPSFFRISPIVSGSANDKDGRVNGEAVGSSSGEFGASGSFNGGGGRSSSESQSPLASSLGGTGTAPPSSSLNRCQADEFCRTEPIAAGLLMAAQKIQQHVSNGWKAPGAERVLRRDYGHQKILATKAMQEKVFGDRVPNDCWSGLGFSRSTPAETLRARLQQLGASAVCRSTIRAPPIDEEEKTVSTPSREDGGDNWSPMSSTDDNDDDDKIGPWIVDDTSRTKNASSAKKGLNATGYFEFVNFNQKHHACLSKPADLTTLLTNLQLTKYIDTFREQEIDIKTFLTMNDEDLRELGVNTFGARRKMLVAISELKEVRNTFS